MKTIPPLVVLVAILARPVVGAELEFVGYFRDSKDPKFVVSDMAEKTSSKWLAIGQSFEGYTLAEFQPKEEILVLKKGDEVLRLRLKPPQVTDGGATATDGTKSTGATISLSGFVRTPGSFPLSADETLASLIEKAGGLAETANAKSVRVSRQEADGSMKIFTVDCESGAAAKEFKLKSNDIVYVPALKRG